MAKRATLNVSLPTRLRKLVETEVKSGRYGSASEVVREGLRLFEEAQRKRLREWLRREIRKGDADIAAGRTHSVEDVFARIRARGVRRSGRTG